MDKFILLISFPIYFCVNCRAHLVTLAEMAGTEKM